MTTFLSKIIFFPNRKKKQVMKRSSPHFIFLFRQKDLRWTNTEK